MKWTYTRRVVDGRSRRVKVHRKSAGGYLVRVVGHRNRRD